MAVRIIALLIAIILTGIGVGTILAMLGVGRVIAVFNHFTYEKLAGLAVIEREERGRGGRKGCRLLYGDDEGAVSESGPAAAENCMDGGTVCSCRLQKAWNWRDPYESSGM